MCVDAIGCKYFHVGSVLAYNRGIVGRFSFHLVLLLELADGPNLDVMQHKVGVFLRFLPCVAVRLSVFDCMRDCPSGIVVVDYCIGCVVFLHEASFGHDNCVECCMGRGHVFDMDWVLFDRMLLDRLGIGVVVDGVAGNIVAVEVEAVGSCMDMGYVDRVVAGMEVVGIVVGTFAGGMD